MWRVRTVIYDFRKWYRMRKWYSGYDTRKRERMSEAGRDFDSRELARYENKPFDGDGETCPRCGAKIEWGGGMVGEAMAWCSRRGCNWGWTDIVGAIARVL